MNYNIKRAEKGLIQTRIQLTKQYDIFITKDSVDMIKEIRNYQYIEDKNSKLTNKPIDDFNHLMDGFSYALIGKKGNNAAAICFNAV
jgi:phage terminase large subunit